VADIDADGELEVLVGSWDNYLYCLNRTGGLEWRYQTGDDIISSPAVVDMDGDGQLEVLVGSRDDYLYCLNRTGGLEWRYQTRRLLPLYPRLGRRWKNGGHRRKQ